MGSDKFRDFRFEERRPRRRAVQKAYGESIMKFKHRLSRAVAGVLFAVICLAAAGTTASAAQITLVALGDSLTAGYGLANEEVFPVRLEKALRARGHDVRVHNAGVSGDTSSGALSRLDWALPAEADAVIVELGANDALRGTDPGTTRRDLSRILEKLEERDLPVLLAGMLAPPNMGSEYAEDFNGIYPELAQRHGAILYPFFLDGVAADMSLNQGDGMHPNARGVDVIVERILPFAEQLIARVKSGGGAS